MRSRSSCRGMTPARAAATRNAAINASAPVTARKAKLHSRGELDTGIANARAPHSERPKTQPPRLLPDDPLGPQFPQQRHPGLRRIPKPRGERLWRLRRCAQLCLERVGHPAAAPFPSQQRPTAGRVRAARRGRFRRPRAGGRAAR